MPDTILSGDFTIYYGTENNQKRIVWTGSATGTRTCNQLYSALLKLFDDSTQMDDGIPIQAVTPDIYRIINQWFIDDTTVEHLTSGSLFTQGWVSGSTEHILIIGSDFATAFSPDDIGRTVLGGTTGDTGTLLDYNSNRGLIWIRPDDPLINGDEFDNTTEAYTIRNDAAAQVWQIDDPAGSPVFVNETTDFNSAGANDVDPWPTSEAIGDQMAVGFAQKFSKLRLNVGTAGVGGTLTWRYWNGTSWTTLSGVSDGTTGLTTSGTNNVTWTAPTDWVARSLNGSASLYYVVAQVATTYSTNPIITQGFVGGQGAGNFEEHARHGGGAAAGESGWAGIVSIGAVQDNTKPFIYQEDPDKPQGTFKEVKVKATKGTGDSWWPQEGHLNILLKVKEANSLFGPNPDTPTFAIATFLMRQYTKTYSHFIGRSLATAGGNTVVPFGTGDDLNNNSGYRQLLTDAATGTWNASDIDTVFQEQGNTNNKAIITSISGTSPNFTIQYYLIYTQEDFLDNDVLENEAQTKTLTVFGAPTDVGPAVLAVTPSFGATTQDINNGNGARPYSIRINPASNELADIYERTKYLTRRGSSTTLLGQPGESYVGSELQIEYTGQSGGNFTQGIKIYDQTSNAEGIVVADHDDGTTGDVILKLVRGTFTAANVLSDSPSPSQTLRAALQVDASPFTITDFTSAAQSAGGADVTPFPGTEATGDYFAIGGSEPFSKVRIDIATSGTVGVVLWEYWNGTAWADLEAVAGFSDGTSNLTASTGFQEVTFPPPLDWVPNSIILTTQEFGPYYYIRARVTTVYTVNPIIDEVQLEDNVTATVGSVRTIVPVAEAPFGAFAGGRFFGAPGLTFTTANLFPGEEQAYQLIDDNGVTQIPPNTISVTLSNLVSGDTVAIFRRSGTNIVRNQFTLTTGNNQGDNTIDVTTTIGTDNPTNNNSKVRVVSVSNQEHRYRYTSYSGTTFTLSAASTGTGSGSSTTTVVHNASATFVTDGVEPGDMIRNTTDNLYSVVVSVDSETQLTVTSNGTTWNAKAYSVNTLVENYPSGQNTYVPLLERIADAATETSQFVLGSSIDYRAVVRRSTLSSPILPFEQDSTITGSTTISTIRSSDDIIT